MEEAAILVPDPVEAVFVSDADRLWRAVFAFARDRDVASDSVAEAFAQVLRRGQAVHDIRAWVWRAAFRLAAAELQRRRREHELREGPGEEDPALSSIELLIQLGDLPARQRAVLVLYYYAGYSTPEIARILGSTRGAVRVSLSRGRRALRRTYSQGEAP